jgi:osomolarity two-component system response regulator SSK1
MQALIDFDGWRKWKDFANASDPMDGKSKMSASFSAIAPPKKKEPTAPTLAANPPDGPGMSVNGIKNHEPDKKGKRKSLGVIPQPVLMEENEVETPETEGSGA